jgi:hypothetical protein
MSSTTKVIIGILIVAALAFILLWLASSWVGWYGYRKWEYRLKSANVAESKAHGVFVTELAYDTASVPVKDFHVFIEKGHHWDKHSDTIYHLIEGSKYPFQVSFTNGFDLGYRILLRDKELQKFDSSDGVWGFLKEPALRDTIVVNIISNSNDSLGSVKVWDARQ